MPQPRARELTDLPPPDSNDSEGALVTHRRRAVLIYEVASSTQLAAVLFTDCLHASAGGPNDEAFHNHPLNASTGPYSIWEVEGSDWLLEQAAISDRDANPERLSRGRRHYVCSFKENTVDLLAAQYRLIGQFRDRKAAWNAASEALQIT
ncbi:MAG TPA: hypothetical protein VD997_10775 [Phycisphaerales bacterium]|nr:hypothetical protein [Phycisphaerales bacterium]